jgi:hypothetical protein
MLRDLREHQGRGGGGGTGEEGQEWKSRIGKTGGGGAGEGVLVCWWSSRAAQEGRYDRMRMRVRIKFRE